jgi:hypothetical protein
MVVSWLWKSLRFGPGRQAAANPSGALALKEETAMYAIAADRISPVPVALTGTAGTPIPVPTAAPSAMRVTLDSLPVPLRVTAGDQSEDGIAFQAELPWLSVGTGLDVELPSGVHQTGWIHSFDLGVTATGSACLRIFAGVSPPERLLSEPPARPAPRLSETQRVLSRVWPLAFVVGASIGAYAGLHAPALRSLFDVAQVAALFAGGK